ncbi:MAG: hypothetical protein U9R38_03400 [Candidatus Margulisiibacteriota bacterium]|nr:hypothetical protein [Candidatus Margulisiibacteriota bacterium]
MTPQHQELASGKWKSLSFVEQMANIGSEVERAISWRNKANQEYSRLAFERSLELLDLSLSAGLSFPRLKELTRLREMLADYFVFGNSFNSTDSQWQKYFLAFNFAARA